MDFWHFVTAIIVRTKEKDQKDVHMVRSFVEAWTTLASLGNNVVGLGPNRAAWRHELENAHPSKQQFGRNVAILAKSRGGIGARDVFDACHVMVRNARAYPGGDLLLFRACACLPTVVSCTLGGSYGTGVVHAFVRGMSNVCPEVLSTHMIQDRFKEFNIRVLGSVADEIRAYTKQICMGIRRDNSALCAGIINHFGKAHGLSTNDIRSATEEEVVAFLSRHPAEAKAYLAQCSGAAVPIQVDVDDDVSCVSLSLSNSVPPGTNVAGVVHAANGAAATSSPAETNPVNVLGKGLAKAEFLWENCSRAM